MCSGACGAQSHCYLGVVSCQMWVLGRKFRSSLGATHTLNPRAIFPAPGCFLTCDVFVHSFSVSPLSAGFPLCINFSTFSIKIYCGYVHVCMCEYVYMCMCLHVCVLVCAYMCVHVCVRCCRGREEACSKVHVYFTELGLSWKGTHIFCKCACIVDPHCLQIQCCEFASS